MSAPRRVASAISRAWRLLVRDAHRTRGGPPPRSGVERWVLAAIAEHSPAAVYLKDLEGRYLFVGRRAAELLGRSSAEYLGRRDEDVYPPRVARRIVANDRRVLASGTPVEFEEVVPGQEGPRTFITIKFPVPDASGRTFAVGGISTDITARKRAEERQLLLAKAGEVLTSSLEEEAMLASIAGISVPALADFCVVDLVEEDRIRRLLVTSASPSRAKLATALRALPIDPTRPHLADAVLESREPALLDQITPAYLDHVSQSAEHRRVLRAIAPRSTIQVPLLVRDRLVGALVFLTAESARRYGPDDLHFAEELGRRVSLALENAHLYALATRAIKAREEILGVVAHDLRNALGTILTSLQLLLARAAPDDKRMIAIAMRSARRMSRLVGDLLDVGRIEAGSLAVERARIPAGDLAVEAADEERPVVAQAGIELRAEIPPDLPPVLADRGRILQVFANLVGNAVKFTERGGRITIGGERDGRAVRFWVSDDGPGIAAGDLPHVFDRFWQGRRDDRRGAGLGLAICKGIVDAHGGTIWATSVVGHGTTMHFTLPVLEDASAASEPGATPHAAERRDPR